MPVCILRRFRSIVVGLLFGAVLAGCTWVETTPEGSRVRIVPMDRVADCTRLGKVTVYTKAEIAGVDRSTSKIEQELEALARNEAANMNGDTIVADTAVTEGRRTYQVYRCL